jgi:hypothetical protein
MNKVGPKLLGVIGTIVFFGIIIGYITEFKYIDCTIGVKKLLLYSAITGIAVGFLVALLTNNDPPNSIEKTRNYLFIILVFFVGSPIIGLKTNRWFADKTKTITPFTFIKQKPVLSKPFGQLKFESTAPTYYLVELSYQGESIKLKSDKQWVSNAQAGKEVYLPVYRGLWGFEIVDIQGLTPDAATI